ncbi:hypothetical protein QBC40DRAFT_280756 [Triangularia verruculosa]|uniref:NB-ARC domain-containing protein n=1 Tax=Triangularia verruculosa TaxID=2587418 RepID=A0AAN6XG18_9PEZI|nr:hypothetical protein QBC40DRAFT_280756 [Triangularia verruculosa]
MSDPFGSLSAGVLLNGLKETLSALERLDVDAITTGLFEQIGDLKAIVECFDQLAISERRNASLHVRPRSPTEHFLHPLIDNTAAILIECDAYIRPLQSSIKILVDEKEQSQWIESEHRLENQPWYLETSLALGLHTRILRALFTAIELLKNQRLSFTDDETQSSSLKARSSLSCRLVNDLGLVRNSLSLITEEVANYDASTVVDAITAAQAVTLHVPDMVNRHFVIPRPVRACFTGRKAELAKLDQAFHNVTKSTQQRFVIYGLGGSGKTELAFKFSNEYKDKFWGVFFVDGSSQKNASSSYAEIATIGGVEPNEKAAKNWLTTRDLPWLLIIDNADDDEINLEQLLPGGDKGCVLITTRNPTHMTHGNAGDRYLELLAMEPKEAEELILRAAEEPRPWAQAAIDSANSICKALGFLPLALVQAAKAILKGICDWPNYLSSYDREIRRIRRNYHGRTKSNSRDKKRIDDDSSFTVFSTYEILYRNLEESPREKCQDAVELLHVFSFFHFQNIRLDLLINAAINPLKEEQQQRQDAEREKELHKRLQSPKRKPWGMFFRELRAYFTSQMSTPPPLPGVLRNRDNLGLEDLEDEVQDRLRAALSVLVERSLVTRQERSTGRYSMHRLIHKWARERPEMSTSHQALWCQISMATLSSSIRRPPHGDNEPENQVRRELLPHITHVRECQAELDKTLAENALRAKPFWQLRKCYGKLQVDQDVCFSRVYAETGHFEEARDLQTRALEYVSARLGPDHPIAIALSLLLTKTLWIMCEMEKVVKRMRVTHQLCVGTWGDHHPLTLDVTETLGSSISMQGKYTEANALHVANLEKIKRLYGDKHPKTLDSTRNLARVLNRRMEYDQASRLFQTAWEGMKETLGPTHLETLTSLEDLSSSFVRHEEDNPDPNLGERLRQSRTDLTFVHEQRKERLGKEHPYTLLARLFLARVESAVGNNKEAEKIIREGIEVAERNIGPHHLAVLMAKCIHAEVLVKLKRYSEAEKLFHTLIDRSWYTKTVGEAGDHPDRLANIWFLAMCLEQQGKWEEALGLCREFLTGIESIGGHGLGMNHKMYPKVMKKIAELERKIAGGSSINKGPFRDNEKGRGVQIKVEEAWIEDVRAEEILV